MFPKAAMGLSGANEGGFRSKLEAELPCSHPPPGSCSGLCSTARDGSSQ